MKLIPAILFSTLGILPLTASDDLGEDRRAVTVILDETGVENLRLKTEVIEPTSFAETVFALGRIDVYPGKRAVISSRIAGAVRNVFIQHDHAVEEGDPAIIIESRQVGDPPPRISLTAPISGLISAVNVVPGQPVNPDDTLAEILDLRKVYALARVPEQFAGRLRRGQSASLHVTAVGGKKFSARLEHLGVLADPVGGTVEAAFRVDNPELKLRPGMRAEFSITVAQRDGVSSVPRSAMQGTPAQRFVYVKDYDLPFAFVKTPVVTGMVNDGRVEILSGLLPFDEVVTQGAYSLAFAGGGSISLKEALDAAHGHEHNADGSEITPDQVRRLAEAELAGTEAHSQSRFWPILSGVLFVALLVVSWRKRPVADQPQR